MRHEISFRFHRDGRVTVAKDKTGKMQWEVTFETDEWDALGEAWKRTDEARKLSTIGLTSPREQEQKEKPEGA